MQTGAALAPRRAARQIVRLPQGIQAEVPDAVRREALSGAELKGVVDLRLGCGDSPLRVRRAKRHANHMIRRFGLRHCAAALMSCASLARGQRPSDADSAALIEKVRQKALDYAQSLPDFFCVEIIQRYAASAWVVKLNPWVHTDTLTVKLSYSNRTERHKLELIDGRPTDRKFEDLYGATSSGEFGGILRTIFDADSQAAFNWDSAKSVRHHRMAVYQYAVSARKSPYYLRHRNHEDIVGLHGTVEVDTATGEVWRLTFVAYDIPQRLDVQSFSGAVEYALASVAGRNYLLPPAPKRKRTAPRRGLAIRWSSATTGSSPWSP